MGGGLRSETLSQRSERQQRKKREEGEKENEEEERNYKSSVYKSCQQWSIGTFSRGVLMLPVLRLPCASTAVQGKPGNITDSYFRQGRLKGRPLVDVLKLERYTVLCCDINFIISLSVPRLCTNSVVL